MVREELDQMRTLKILRKTSETGENVFNTCMIRCTVQVNAQKNETIFNGINIWKKNVT